MTHRGTCIVSLSASRSISRPCAPLYRHWTLARAAVPLSRSLAEHAFLGIVSVTYPRCFQSHSIDLEVKYGS
jgi:hypothetical protein